MHADLLHDAAAPGIVFVVGGRDVGHMVFSQPVHQGAARLSGDPAVPELPAEGVTEVMAVSS